MMHWAELLPYLSFFAMASCWILAAHPRYETGVLITWGLVIMGFGFFNIVLEIYENDNFNVDRLGVSLATICLGVIVCTVGCLWKINRGKKRMSDWVGVNRRHDFN